METTINKKNIDFLFVDEIDYSVLSNFYRIAFPSRVKEMELVRKWVDNFPLQGNKRAMVAVYDKRVVAHVGILPSSVIIESKQYLVSWFVDFFVLDDFRNQGIGSLLVDKLMCLSDFSMALAAEKSGNLFKRCGWKQVEDTYLLVYPLNPFFHPKFKGVIPYFLKLNFNRLYHLLYKKKYNKSLKSPLKFSFLNPENIKLFSEKVKSLAMRISPLYSYAYLSWRLLESLNREKYRFLDLGEIKAIVKFGSKDQGGYLDVLCLSDLSNRSLVVSLLASLGSWGVNNGFAFMRQYTSSCEISDYLIKEFKPCLRKPPFLVYAKDQRLRGKIKKNKWSFQFIDSDFELM